MFLFFAVFNFFLLASCRYEDLTTHDFLEGHTFFCAKNKNSEKEYEFANFNKKFAKGEEMVIESKSSFGFSVLKIICRFLFDLIKLPKMCLTKIIFFRIFPHTQIRYNSTNDHVLCLILLSLELATIFYCWRLQI